MASQPVLGDISERLTFWRRLGRELGPLATHAAAVLFLDVFLLLIALLLQLVSRLEEKYEYLLAKIEKGDILFVLIVSSLFGFYALSILGIRLYFGIRLEYHDRVREFEEQRFTKGEGPKSGTSAK